MANWIRNKPWIVGLLLIGAVFMYVGGTYNHLVRLDQGVQAQWAQVETVYQRRADLIPNLVRTVSGAAQFERGTLEAVTAARAKVTALPTQLATQVPATGAQMQQFQQAQDGLSTALTRFFAVAESYPQLTATANYRDLQSQLEGTENRIAVERMRFNQAAQGFNASRQSFPTNLIAGMFGSRFDTKNYFQSQPGAAQVPEVKL